MEELPWAAGFQPIHTEKTLPCWAEHVFTPGQSLHIPFSLEHTGPPLKPFSKNLNCSYYAWQRLGVLVRPVVQKITCGQKLPNGAKTKNLAIYPGSCGKKNTHYPAFKMDTPKQSSRSGFPSASPSHSSSYRRWSIFPLRATRVYKTE